MKPALRDNLGIAGEDTGARIIGAMVRTKGEAFVKRLKEQNIRMHMMAGSALTQLVAAGEIFGSPSQFYSATNVAAKRGAPVAWVPMDLVVASAGGAAVYVNAPRPHAALLFVDFLLSPEGQKLYEDLFSASPRKITASSAGIPNKVARSLNTTKRLKDGTNCSKKSLGSEPEHSRPRIKKRNSARFAGRVS